MNNGTKRLIREGVIFLSFNIQNENGIAGNEFKQSWRLGEDVKPGQRMEISMTADTRIFDQEKINFNYISLELIGYLDDLEPRNLFHVGQSNNNIEGEGDRQWEKL
ncbi:hypothetical protein HMPREF9372_1436 [Sporosarcina newyorkensis 2681]|uniref:Uncharacterized protein n=1 Tax=Sporosarcina newyorkensis 2681 TaxID=1027292 RepID=F9DRK6_9BACL|nr:hypothetical protein [Sporosarcina newyorkensis]EGQ26509.1 hypothetical protein HMPREF9372_1436 [Sporosarcina newyorkensis 2681]